MDSDSDEEFNYLDADHCQEISENEEQLKVERICEQWRSIFPELEIIGSPSITQSLYSIFEKESLEECEVFFTEKQEQFYDTLLEVFIDRNEVDQEWYAKLRKIFHTRLEKLNNKYFVTGKQKVIIPPLKRYPPFKKNHNNLQSNNGK